MKGKLGIFRSTLIGPGEVSPRNTMRPPGNVPYIVDNLWEWKRPEEFPNRRLSVFASPQPELALKAGPVNGKVFRVELQGSFKLCQVKQCEDSKYHPDCRNLIRLFLRLIGQEWVDAEINEKIEIGRIFMPCLRKNEMEELFNRVETLRKIRDKIYEAITYWETVQLLKNVNEIRDDEGEIFFETKDKYFLREL